MNTVDRKSQKESDNDFDSSNDINKSAKTLYFDDDMQVDLVESGYTDFYTEYIAGRPSDYNASSLGGSVNY